jgi:hypothetical protein
MLYVPDLKVNLLSVATFEDDGYIVTFKDGQVRVHSREVAPDTTIVLGVHIERMYRLLRRPRVWTNGFLESYSASNSMSDSASALEALSEVRSCETPPSTMGMISP